MGKQLILRVVFQIILGKLILIETNIYKMKLEIEIIFKHIFLTPL